MPNIIRLRQTKSNNTLPKPQRIEVAKMPNGEKNNPKDITCLAFARFLKTRKLHYPISDRYIEEIHDSPDKTGEDEREHMVAWFMANETHGHGSYSRNTPNTSAKTCYGRLGNAGSLLWIAEATGVPDDMVNQAFEAAVEAGDHRRACGAIRKIIPWTEVQNRAEKLMSRKQPRFSPFGRKRP